MRIVRFEYKDCLFWGSLEDGLIRVFESGPFNRIKFSGLELDHKKARILAPAVPGKIILVGLNYIDHAKELNMPLPDEPVIFLKPATALIASGDNIVYPGSSKRVEYEGELALVINQPGRNIPVKGALGFVLGYGCLNDVTARDLQKKDGQWTRAKSFDTFCPFGPWLETEINPADLRVRTFLNGKLRQDSSTRNMIFPVAEIISHISRIMTLLPGDIISTGTPAGVGVMAYGDEVVVEIDGVGRLCNKVSRK